MIMNIRIIYEIYLNVFKSIKGRKLVTEDVIMPFYDFINKSISDQRIVVNTEKLKAASDEI